MGNWTAKKVAFVAASEDVEEREGQVRGRGSVELDDCPFKQEVTDEVGKVVRVECADSSGVKPCNPEDDECKLQKWMASVKAFIRQIDIDAL